MVTNYKKAKNDVLEIYGDFLELVKKANYSADVVSMEALATQAKRIEEDSFCLMVAGEAKSGKSTFINAYLNTEILPMGVKQCTSSVIEIRYGEKFILSATYADGRNKQILNEEDIRSFLIANAALDDNYRDIPTTIINNELLVVKKGKPIYEKEISALIDSVKHENIHRLSADDYSKKIRKYIDERQSKWMDIVVKMVIDYPFSDKEMKGIHIIDSPGVNAAGRVGDATAEYIESADAIMFLRPITGQAIEANSFKDFLESKSVDRNKNAMFLILTRKAAESDDVIETAYDEYVNMFGVQNKGDRRHGIVKEQIIPVDSKAQIYYNEFQNLTTDEITARIKELKELSRAEPFLKLAWGEAMGDKNEFLSELKKYSNFDSVNRSLNKFGRKAQFLALSDFLARILKIYEKIAIKLRENIRLNELKAEDPNKLAVDISETKASIIEIENKMNKIVDEITQKYAGTGDKSIIASEAEKVLAQYKDEINSIDGNDDSSLEVLEKKSFRYVEKFSNYEKDLQKKLIEECDQALIKLSDDNNIESVELVPDLTPEIVAKIKQDVKNSDESKESYTYTTGVCFSKTHTGTRFSQERYFGAVKNNISERIENIKLQVIRDLRGFVSKTAVAYTKQLSKNADDKKNELNEILQRKQSADEMEKYTKDMKELLASVEPCISKVREYKGGIDGNV